MTGVNPLVSVIIPCYNCGQFLEETLNSVLNQSYSNWECIIVDNASTDNSADVAKKIVEKDKRFHYTFVEHKGVSLARNMGIKSANGLYILPLDADDNIGKQYMELAIPILENNPQIKLVYCEAELFGESSGKWKLTGFSLKNLLIGNIIFCTSFFRKEDFNKTSGYDETLSTGLEDWDFWIRLLGTGGEVYKLPGVHFFYRIRKQSRNTGVNEIEQQLIRKKIYNNHIELYSKYFTSQEEVYRLFIERNKQYQSAIIRLFLNLLRVIKQLFKL